MPTVPHVPKNYRPLAGSERRPAPGARRIGAAEEDEAFNVTVVLRRRPDGPPVPDFSHYLHTPPAERRKLSAHEFTARYGASEEDIERVGALPARRGLPSSKPTPPAG